MGEEIRLDKVQARQGTNIPRVRYVLAGSLVLAMAAFVILMSYHF